MVSISAFAERLRNQKEVVSGALDGIKEEIEDHLVAINENTNEIQCNYEYLCLLEAKMEKLAARIDHIQLFLQKSTGFVAEDNPQYEVAPLSREEKDVFLILYTLEERKGAVSYADLARYCCLTEELAANYVLSMIEKGVPITKKYINNRAYLRLDKKFKQVQAKQNILKIEQKSIKNWG